jgi:DNA-binding HxlR family transcriptional regulator
MEMTRNIDAQLPMMYAADCPTRRMLDRIGDKWTTLIMALLASRPRRFAELQHTIGGISQKMLTQTLRNLERDGLVLRTVYSETPIRVEYALTPLGKTLCGALETLIRWTEEHFAEVSEAQREYDAVRDSASGS